MGLAPLPLDGSLLTYVLVFLAGIVTSICPCSMASVPLMMAYVGGSDDRSRGRAFALSLSFAVGTAFTFMLLGIAASAVGGVFGAWDGWFYLLAGVCFLIGLHLLGVFNFPIPTWFSGLPRRIPLRGLLGALVMGLTFGMVTSHCSTPMLAVILTTVMAHQDGLAYGARLLFIYALGHGMPVVVAGTSAAAWHGLRKLGPWSAHIDQVSGVVIIGVGFYLLWIA